MSINQSKELLIAAERKAQAILDEANEEAARIISSAENRALSLGNEFQKQIDKQISEILENLDLEMFNSLKLVVERVLLAELRLQPETIFRRIEKAIEHFPSQIPSKIYLPNRSLLSSSTNSRKDISQVDSSLGGNQAIVSFDEFDLDISPISQADRIFDEALKQA